MSENSPNLALPYLLAAQAQKHVTVNEALRILDGLVQLSVLESRASPPVSPAPGARYLVTAAASGLWEGWEGSIALWDDNAWRRLVPRSGWFLWDAGAGRHRRFDGTVWKDVAIIDDFASGEVAALGIATGADATNRLAVAAPATLLTHAGAGHQLKINKADPGDTGTVLFQTDWSGRAEMGLAGADDFSFKVSPDGASWQTALEISAASGIPGLRTGATIGGHRAFHRGNVLGAVAQEAGVPAGALLEHGTNANGNFLRFADGTQICWRTVTLDSVAITTAFAGWFISDSFDYTFAAAFSARPTAMVVADRASGGSVGNYAQPDLHNATRVRFRWARLSSATQNVSADILAIGRWF